MLPRITKIQRLYRHPNASDLWVVRVYGSEHQMVVPRHGVTYQLFPNEAVVYLPLDLMLPERVATALEIQQQCEPCERHRRVTTSSQVHWREQWNPLHTRSIDMIPSTANRGSDTDNGNKDSGGGGDAAAFARIYHRKGAETALSPIYYRVVARKHCGIVSCGIVLPLKYVVNALTATTTPSSSALLLKRPSTVIRSLRFVPVRPAPPPLVDLLQNPSLLSALLDTPIWMSERISGHPVTIQYDACNHGIRYWDEHAVTDPHSWWTGAPTRSGARELPPDSARAQLFEPFAVAIMRIGRERYAQAIDIYLRGIVCANGAVYFYECALHGARSFVLSAEQFIRLCEASRLPRVPTLYANRTLRSIINERLGRRRPLIPRISGSGGNSDGGDGGNDKQERRAGDDSEDGDNKELVHRHVYDYNKAKKIKRKQRVTMDLLSASASSSASAACSWRRSTPIDPQYHGFSNFRRNGRGRKNGDNNHECSGGVGVGGHSERDGGVDDRIKTPNDEEFESSRFGNIPNDRVDWARCLVIIANHLSDRSREHSRHVIGFVLQFYKADDAFRLLRRFRYMQHRVGAQVLCEHELIERGGCVRLRSSTY